MRTRHHPLKWPLSVSLALVLFFGAIFIVPEEWINFIFSPSIISEVQTNDTSAQWMIILPPPVLETLPMEVTVPEESNKQPQAPPAEDPGWWTQGWQVQAVNETTLLLTPSKTDSVTVLMQALGVGMDFSHKALPDSILAHQLMLLKIEDGFAFEELKPYLKVLTRARAMMDKKSRESDMYDEHLQSTIMVPD